MNSDNFSAYPEEDEVLLQDGIEYEVIKCEPEINTQTIHGITFEKKHTLVTLEKKNDKYSQMNCFVRTIKLFFD